MTKYLLNSGGIRNSSDRGEKFFREVVSGLGANPRLLICVFAQPREDWEEKYAEDVAFFRELFDGDIQLVLDLAFPDTFEEQIRKSDAIYIHGGDDYLIQYWLKKFDLQKLFDGKTDATNSGSSHAMSRYFWTCDWRQNMEGLGILPIKFLAHFKSNYGKDDPRGPIDWDRAYASLQDYGDKDLPIYALKEGEYIMLEA